mgnify:CR=1 FL=1
MNKYKYIGKRFQREDSLERVIGATKFLADIKRYNMLYGKLILSEKPHAEISFDFDEAFQEGVEETIDTITGIFDIIAGDDDN